MYHDLINKIASNKDSRFIIERLVDFDEKDKININIKNGMCYIEIIKDNNNYIIITLKGTLNNFTDITVYERIEEDIIFNSLYYSNGDKFFVDEINDYTEIKKNNDVIYVRKDNKEYFINYKNEIMLRENGKYFYLKLENNKYKKYLTSENDFDDFIYFDDEVDSFRKEK